jgi:hypothetical protein
VNDTRDTVGIDESNRSLNIPSWPLSLGPESESYSSQVPEGLNGRPLGGDVLNSTSTGQTAFRMMPPRQAQNHLPLQLILFILIIMVAFCQLILDLQEPGMLVF